MSLTRAECERIAGDVRTPPDDLWRAILATLLRLEERAFAAPAEPGAHVEIVRKRRGA